LIFLPGFVPGFSVFGVRCSVFGISEPLFCLSRLELGRRFPEHRTPITETWNIQTGTNPGGKTTFQNRRFHHPTGGLRRYEAYDGLLSNALEPTAGYVRQFMGGARIGKREGQSGRISNPPEDTILIVDDEPANPAVVANCLANSGFRVKVARIGETGNSAIE
jgi:hypothetical protein